MSKAISRQERAKRDCSGSANAGAEYSAGELFAVLSIGAGAGAGATGVAVMRSAGGLAGGRTILGITISHCALAAVGREARLPLTVPIGVGSCKGGSATVDTSATTDEAASLATGVTPDAGSACGRGSLRYVQVTGNRNQAKYSTLLPG